MTNWMITSKTRIEMRTHEHLSMLTTMIRTLNDCYDRCEEEREFSKVYTLIRAFRDIIMTWPIADFSLAYDELSEWQSAYMGSWESF